MSNRDDYAKRVMPTKPPVPEFVEKLLETEFSGEAQTAVGRVLAVATQAKALAFLRAVLRECRDTDTDWVGRKWAELHTWAGAEANEEDAS